MHLAAMIASIARNETRTDVTIIRDPARDAGYRHRGGSIGLTPEQYKAVVDGLVACARPGGTGSSVSRGLEGRLTVASKTGTAQIKRNTANLAWTIAYAPVENPEVALAVLIEGKDGNTDFGGGKNAGPVANSVLLEWLKIREKEIPPATKGL
jgi:penicillin-binding protein 2